MDDLDHQLIAQLRSDARQPIASLSAALGVSRSTVKARLDRLMESGVVQGFTVVLNAENRPAAVRAVTMIEVDGRNAERVIARLRGFPEVRSLQTTNGRWDVVALIETASLPEFDDTLRRIRLIDGISATETSILLSSRKGGVAQLG
jgi:DNA-binding Lrp family transcriptional regulator